MPGFTQILNAAFFISELFMFWICTSWSTMLNPTEMCFRRSFIMLKKIKHHDRSFFRVNIGSNVSKHGLVQPKKHPPNQCCCTAAGPSSQTCSNQHHASCCKIPQTGLALMGFSRYCPSSLDLPNFVVRRCRGAAGPAQARFLEIWGPGNP